MAMIVVVLVGCSSAQTRELKILSLCEALAQLPSLKGKEVAVRGMWFATDEGRWLVPSDSKCPRHLITEGFVWNNSIHLVEANAPFYHENSRAESDLDRKLKVANHQPERYFVVITFIGRLETRVPPQVVRSPDGMVTGYGFGHLNISPAELTYTRFTDVKLVEEKPPPKAP
jgi:hypothetical protein